MAAERGVWYPDPRIPRRRRIEYDFGWQIGVDQFQNPATRIRVVVEPTGEVVTAFPIRQGRLWVHGHETADEI